MPECKYGRSTKTSRLRPLGLCLKRPCKTGRQPPCTRKSSARDQAFTELQNIAKTARHRQKQAMDQSELARIGRQAHLPKQHKLAELKEDNKPIVLTVGDVRFIGRYNKSHNMLHGVHDSGRVYSLMSGRIQYVPVKMIAMQNGTWNYLAKEDRSTQNAFDKIKLQELTQMLH